MGHDEELTFAELIEAGQLTGPEPSLSPGDRVRGKVVLITEDLVFIDYGAKSEGWADLQEFKDDQGWITITPGMELELTLVGYGPSGAQLGRSLKALGRETGRILLKKAFESQLTVEGTVTGINSGGMEVSIGGVRAFCPFSQVDLVPIEKPEIFLGTTQKFKVLQYEAGGRKVVLTRRSVLQEEKEIWVRAFMKNLTVGSVVPGQITRLTPFGAFVDLGGVEGLVHISEISRSQVQDPSDFLSVGQEVSVKVLDIKTDQKNEPRISLSLKALEPDPWEHELGFEEGDILQGTIRHLVPYGAFVEIAPGLEGLVHISEICHKRIHHPREKLKVGQEVMVLVLEINREQKKLSLSIKDVPPTLELESDALPIDSLRLGRVIRRRPRTEAPVSPQTPERAPTESPEPSIPPTAASTGPRVAGLGWKGKGIVRAVKPYGFFVDLPELGPGQSGLLHISQIQDPGKGRRQSGPKEGEELEVQIIKIDEQGRISLSQKSLVEGEEQEAIKAFRDRFTESGKLGTLADLIKKPLKEKP